jgi:hypothetical protein
MCSEVQYSNITEYYFCWTRTKYVESVRGENTNLTRKRFLFSARFSIFGRLGVYLQGYNFKASHRHRICGPIHTLFVGMFIIGCVFLQNIILVAPVVHKIIGVKL